MQGTMPGAHRQACKATHGLDGQHQDVYRTLRGRVNQNDSDRGRLKNRTEQTVSE